MDYYKICMNLFLTTLLVYFRCLAGARMKYEFVIVDRPLITSQVLTYGALMTWHMYNTGLVNVSLHDVMWKWNRCHSFGADGPSTVPARLLMCFLMATNLEMVVKD